MDLNKNIGFIGAGNMAYAIASGLLSKNLGYNVYVSSRTEKSLARFTDHLDIQQAFLDNDELIKHCGIVILSVKPQVMKTMLDSLKEAYHKLDHKPVFVSVAAGVTIQSIVASIQDEHAKIAKIMPNTPSQIGEGMSGVFMNQYCSSEDIQNIENIADSIGDYIVVDDEEDIHTVVGISGSGPAYFYLFIENLIEAGIANGLSQEQSQKLALQTAKGSALIAYQEKDVALLRKQVTSPNGTTEQGIKALMEANLKQIVLNTVNAAKNRSIELADENN